MRVKTAIYGEFAEGVSQLNFILAIHISISKVIDMAVLKLFLFFFFFFHLLTLNIAL